VPGLVRPVTDERDALLAYLDQARHVVRVAAHGLTDEQARATPCRSALSIGGLVKHLAFVEQVWAGTVEQVPHEGDYTQAFALHGSETLADALAQYDAAAARTAAVVAAHDLDDPVPVPPDRPWLPQDVQAWSVRWVLLHLLQETARHAGHADIVREQLDGATALPLMAAAEGWPATPWVQPWAPGSDVG
jgi:uncharacterized damage-inducible protein DinB